MIEPANLCLYQKVDRLMQAIQSVSMAGSGHWAFIDIGISHSNRRIMIHQPVSSFYEGQAGECLAEAEEVLRTRDCITGTYAKQTVKPFWVVSRDMERDAFMSSDEALVYGLIDSVAAEQIL